MESKLLQRLNDQQIKAVTTTSQYCRIIAGAGSGKTRVLTNRYVYLIQANQVYPNQILAITFTNKAANEIKSRIINFLPDISEKLLNVFTFHSFCARFLRKEIEVLNIPSSFTIVDEEDQKSIIKRILKAEGYQSRSAMLKDLPSYISYQKNLGFYPSDVVIKSFNSKEKEKLRLYKLYQEELEKCNQLDFDDLLLRAIEILRQYPDIRKKWQNKFKDILIDEFQDTNDIQYDLVNLLLNPLTNLYVVGDPDQTIYTWRGANQNILLDMKKLFPNIETIILEENYRSTGNILNVANKLIAFNKKRIPKKLFTSNSDGEEVVYNDFYDSYTEARYVIQTISDLVKSSKYVYKDIVIMYRANYLTLPYEKLLVQNQIPYIIHGGQKFYQRKEVKDILAYLRLIINKNDNVSLERIFNIPKRGIGDTSIERLRDEAVSKNQVYYTYISEITSDNSNIPNKALDAMKSVVNLIDDLTNKIAELPINEFLSYLLEAIHYKEYLTLTEENADERYENVETLITDIVGVMKENSDLTLEAYLENIALMSAQDYVKNSDVVTLMTVHTAKGLEFPVVFVIGLNDGVFPSSRAIEEDNEEGLEEERRVCYVAFTRAMEKLFVSSFHMGLNGQFTSSSCFVNEAGLKEIARKQTATNNSYPFYGWYGKSTTNLTSNINVANKITWHIGDCLNHITFGKGVVIGVEDTLISVRFSDGNIKKLLGLHSSITKIERDENNGA